MKNKTVKMILAVAVLVVCCGAYAGVKTYVSHQEQKESEEEEEESSTTVFSASADDIESLDFMVDDTETTFEKSDDTWVKKDEKDFPVNQSTLDSAASSVASIESDRVLEDVEDLAEYGLDSPANTIKIVSKVSDSEEDTEDASDSEGSEDTSDSDSSESSSDSEESTETTTTILYVGDENQSTSQYYVRKDDDEKTVYLVDASCVEPFAKTLYDYAQGEDFPAISSTDTISKITVKGDKSYELSKDEGTSLWSVSGDGDEEKADSATVSSLVSSFGSMAYDSLVNYNCTDESEYGLDDPYATITVDYQEEKETEEDSESTDSSDAEEVSSDDEAAESDANEDSDEDTTDESGDENSSEDAENSGEDSSEDSDADSDSDTEEDAEPEMVDAQLVIKVGNTADDGNRYVMVNDSKEVYTMSEDTLSALTDKTEEDFWDMTVSYVSVNNLATLKLNYQGEDHKINVSRETSTDDDGNETETVTYKLDGTETDSTTFTTFYNKLINMAAQKRLTDKFEPEGDPELTATMTEEDGDSLEVKYYSYDTNYYAAVVGEKVYLVNKMNVKELFTALDTLVASEDENTDEQEATDADTEDTEEQSSEDTTDVEESSSEESDSSAEDDSSETTDNAEADAEDADE